MNHVLRFATVVAVTAYSGIAMAQDHAAHSSQTAAGNIKARLATSKSAFRFVPQAVRYPHSYTAGPPRVGDGSDAQGGIAPVLIDKEPEVIKSNIPIASWLLPLDRRPGPANGEAKFRTHCNYSHHAYDDPIVFPGIAGGAHLHTFFGNTKTNASSTYASLRTSGRSTCGGGPINRSAYWYPAVLKDNAIGDGKTMVVKPDFATLYYNVDEKHTARVTRTPRGLSYVFGLNPSDPYDNMQRNEVAASGGANAYLNNGFLGWRCESRNGAMAGAPSPANPLQPYLRNADGSGTLFCPKSERLGAVLSGPGCWDGVNLTSPNGRGHVRQYVMNVTTGRQDLCPIGWYHIARFQMTIWFSHRGYNDYTTWYLSSDRMRGMTQFLNGQSMHADWFGAWDYSIMKTWMIHCNGTKIPGEAKPDPRRCSDTQFAERRKGITRGAAPDGSRLPQITTVPMTDLGKDRFDPLP